jgi:hypothetical protein
MPITKKGLKDDIIYLSQEQSAALSKEGSMLFGK